MPTLGLCMIVKNEAHVIERCLDSVADLIDYVLIEDTGSTDGTQDIVRDWLDRSGIAGRVIDQPWGDFVANRTSALASLRDRADIDYAFVMDADDVVVCGDGFDPAAFKAGLTEDLYHVEIRLPPITYFRPQICRNRLDFRYRGVLHEFLEGPGGHSTGTARGLHIRSGRDGARSRDPRKYRNDAETLECALAVERDPFLISRYTFYLAQSWRDIGEKQKALARYLERADLGFWKEEIFVSLYYAAQLKEQLGHADSDIIGSYLKAYEACPSRAESLHGAMRYCRINSKFHQGYLIGERAVNIPQPASGLFLHEWIYEYGVLDEFSLLAYWSEHYAASLDACVTLLHGRKIPADQRARNREECRVRATARLNWGWPVGAQNLSIGIFR